MIHWPFVDGGVGAAVSSVAVVNPVGLRKVAELPNRLTEIAKSLSVLSMLYQTPSK